MSEETKRLDVRDVPQTVLDGIDLNATIEGLSRQDYLRQMLKRMFYDDGLMYQQKLKEAIKSKG